MKGGMFQKKIPRDLKFKERTRRTAPTVRLTRDAGPRMAGINRVRRSKESTHHLFETPGATAVSLTRPLACR
jgi:hypothetical protein